MALFVPNPYRPRGVFYPVAAPLPAFLRLLDLLCHGGAHALPVRMRFVGESVSRSGQPTAVYACPIPGCSCREGWVQDYRTGRPFRLWAGLWTGQGRY
jgi:hypothetical protein